MPRYHFSICDGVRLLDADGTELPDRQAVWLEAVRWAGELLKDEPQSVALREDWRIGATDGTGLILFQVTFLTIESPVIWQDNQRQC